MNTDRPYTGTVTSHYEGGQLSSEIAFEDGVLSGPARYWHENGAIKSEGQHSGGLPSGSWVEYDEADAKSASGEMRAGHRQGTWEEWYPSGAKKREVTYDSGFRHGPFREWGEDGKLQSEGTIACNRELADKDYYFPEVRIRASIRPDGSVLVQEDRTFRFQGSFSWGHYSVPGRTPSGRRVRVADLVVGEGDEQYSRLERDQAESAKRPGTFWVSYGESRDSAYAKWFYSAQDVERTFRVSYILRDVLSVHQDVAELDWQYIGEGWDRPTRTAELRLELPRDVPAGSVRAHVERRRLEEPERWIEDQRFVHVRGTFLTKGHPLHVGVTFPADALGSEMPRERGEPPASHNQGWPLLEER